MKMYQKINNKRWNVGGKVSHFCLEPKTWLSYYDPFLTSAPKFMWLVVANEVSFKIEMSIRHYQIEICSCFWTKNLINMIFLRFWYCQKCWFVDTSGGCRLQKLVGKSCNWKLWKFSILYQQKCSLTPWKCVEAKRWNFHGHDSKEGCWHQKLHPWGV